MIRWSLSEAIEPGEEPGFLLEWDGLGDLEGKASGSLLLSEAELDALVAEAQGARR